MRVCHIYFVISHNITAKETHFTRKSITITNMKKSLMLVAGILMLALVSCNNGNKEGFKNPYEKDMAWWREARYGMFIHWGISSLMGQEISWSRNGYGAARYDSLALRFNPTDFDADKWIDVAEKAGMKYMILTAKHHDGYCLWDTKTTDHCITKSPYGKDVCAQLAEAAHRRGMRIGWYFSCRDWHEPDCSSESRNDVFVEKMKQQLTELLSNYGKIDIIWFDYEGWASPAKPREIFELVRSLQPEIIVNNRHCVLTPSESHCYVTDIAMYATPEQFVGAYSKNVPWETNSTTASSRQWSIRYGDVPRPVDDMIWEIMGAPAGNGNFLMNVGPDSLGVIPQAYAESLGKIGDWFRQHDGILYGTHTGPWKPAEQYFSTARGKSAYLLLKEGQNITLPYRKSLSFRSIKADDGSDVAFNTHGDSITLTLPEALIGKRNVALRIEAGSALDEDPLDKFSTSGSLAFQCPIKASSSMGAYLHCATSAVDDDDYTQWLSGRKVEIDSIPLYGQSDTHFVNNRDKVGQYYETDATLEVDLRQTQSVSRFRILHGGDHPVGHITLEYQKDGKWETAASTNQFNAEWTGTITPTEARHWRLNMQDGFMEFGIREFQLFKE